MLAPTYEQLFSAPLTGSTAAALRAVGRRRIGFLSENFFLGRRGGAQTGGVSTTRMVMNLLFDSYRRVTITLFGNRFHDFVVRRSRPLGSSGWCVDVEIPFQGCGAAFWACRHERFFRLWRLNFSCIDTRTGTELLKGSQRLRAELGPPSSATQTAEARATATAD